MLGSERPDYYTIRSRSVIKISAFIELKPAQLVPSKPPMVPTDVVVRGRQNPLHFKFPERLRRARKLAGISGAALSAAAGLGHSGVGVLEVGAHLPRVNTIERLARALDVSPTWLAFGLVVPLEKVEGPLRCEGLRERLREAQELCGLSLREVARRAGAGEGVAAAVKRGTMPTIDTLETLAKALDVSPAWLAYGLGPMEASRRRMASAARPL